jgi:peptidoglycan biosynthesis protein MviN/MurJ (putative lipid II flippase)
MDRLPVRLTPPAAPSLRAYVALAALAGLLLLCVGPRRRGPLVDLYIAPGAADLFASLAAIGATLTAALVLWWHLRPRRSGQPRQGALRIVGASGLSAALVWALMQASVPPSWPCPACRG